MSVISEPHTYEQFTTNLAKNTQTHELEPVLFRLCRTEIRHGIELSRSVICSG